MIAAVLPLVPAWRVDKTFDYVVPDKLRADIQLGTLVRIPFGGRIVRGFVLGLSETEPGGDLEVIKAVVVAEPLVPPPLPDLAGAIAARYVVPRARVFARFVPPRVRVSERAPAVSERGGVVPRLLSAYDGGDWLVTALRDGKPGTWCVQVVPGEDRGRLIAELVSAAGNGAALVLVPEVRYGSLVLERVAWFLPHLVRVDSAQNENARSAAWLHMAAGHPLAGGGRAAVFTPAPELGLIVVDEEHHQTYKEDRSPRYDARWVAVERARAQSAICVFISASPSLETGFRAAEGTYGSVTPPRVARRAARPVVELVDRPDDRSIGHELHARISSTLTEGARVALLVPSPAFARAVWCGDCHRSLRCTRCEAGLFFERSSGRVRCARCGFAEPAPDLCPSCGARDFKLVGAGTERLAEQLSKAFPRSAVARVDPAHPDALVGRQVDIYVTTWMGTKPELRPDVSLVGVIDADWLVRRPDFRSSESAYQAMIEMSEWAGPAARGGRLVVQTTEPGHHSLQAVVRGEYPFFLRKEMELRRELAYPPVVELVKVLLDGPRAAAVVDEVVGAIDGLDARVLGPAEIHRPGGTRALQLLIKCRDAGAIAARLRVILESAPKGARVSVDVDPR